MKKILQCPMCPRKISTQRRLQLHIAKHIRINNGAKPAHKLNAYHS